MNGLQMRAILALLGIMVLAPRASADERVDRLTEEHKAWLEREVVYIITEREREVFLTPESVEERNRFIEAFWRKRDPNPATLDNEYKIEHYRRIDYANTHLGRETSREGWRTDRGRYYILLGEPREIQRFDGYGQIVSSHLWFYQGDLRMGTRMVPAHLQLADIHLLEGSRTRHWRFSSRSKSRCRINTTSWRVWDEPCISKAITREPSAISSEHESSSHPTPRFSTLSQTATNGSETSTRPAKRSSARSSSMSTNLSSENAWRSSTPKSARTEARSPIELLFDPQIEKTDARLDQGP